MNARDTLRLNGYHVDESDRILCHPGAAHQSRDYHDATPRFQFERVAVIRFDVERGNARELVDQIIAGADVTPRALVGRQRNGATVILFRLHRDFPIAPTKTADTTEGAYKLAAKDDSARFTLTVGSVGHAVDVSAFTWQKNRTPMDIDRDALPVLTVDVSNAVVETATSIATSPRSLEYQRQNEAENERIRERMAKGDIPTLEEIQAKDDEETVARWEGQDVSFGSMGNAGLTIQQARARVAARKATKADPDGSRKDAEGLRLLRSLFGG